MAETLPTSRLKLRLTWSAALIGPVVLGAALYPARGHVMPANLALIFVLAIVVIAGLGFRGPAALVAAVSGLSFDYFCTVPYLTLRMSREADMTTTLLLLVIGLTVGQIAARARRARRAAVASGERIQRVHALGERLAAGHDTVEILATTVNELIELLSLRDCQYIPGPMTPVTARIRRDGSVTVGQHVWRTEKLGLPTQHIGLAVRAGGFVIGTLVLTPTPGVPIEREQAVVAVALADQIATALAGTRMAG